ncbi:putative metal homeostasis protein [Pediococcus claussenii]|nr:putative metal homeostasis protein [Pediococcus claussenii]
MEKTDLSTACRMLKSTNIKTKKRGLRVIKAVKKQTVRVK